MADKDMMGPPAPGEQIKETAPDETAENGPAGEAAPARRDPEPLPPPAHSYIEDALNARARILGRKRLSTWHHAPLPERISRRRAALNARLEAQNHGGEAEPPAPSEDTFYLKQVQAIRRNLHQGRRSFNDKIVKNARMFLIIALMFGAYVLYNEKFRSGDFENELSNLIASLPRPLDKETTLEKISEEDGTFVITVIKEPGAYDDLDAAGREALIDGIAARAPALCGDRLIAHMMAKGLDVRVSFRARDGSFAREITLKECPLPDKGAAAGEEAPPPAD